MKYWVWIEGPDGTTRTVEVEASGVKAATVSVRVELAEGEFIRGVNEKETV